MHSQLYNFTSFTFTTAGAKGRFGPTLAMLRQNYSQTRWTQNDSFLTIDPEYPGMQLWTVPANGTYRITAAGAAGGGTGSGFGAIITGDFDLVAGHRYEILVGQRGVRACGQTRCSNSGGGGGATAIFRHSPYTSGPSDYEEMDIDQRWFQLYDSGEYNSFFLVVAGGGGGGNGDFLSTFDNSSPPKGSARTWFPEGESTYDACEYEVLFSLRLYFKILMLLSCCRRRDGRRRC